MSSGAGGGEEEGRAVEGGKGGWTGEGGMKETEGEGTGGREEEEGVGGRGREADEPGGRGRGLGGIMPEEEERGEEKEGEEAAAVLKEKVGTDGVGPKLAPNERGKNEEEELESKGRA